MLHGIRNARRRWVVVAAAVALLSVGLVGGSVAAAGIADRDDDDRLRHANGLRRSIGTATATAPRCWPVSPRYSELRQTTWRPRSQSLWTSTSGSGSTRASTLWSPATTLTQEQGNVAKTWFGSRPRSSGDVAIHLIHTADITAGRDIGCPGWWRLERLTQDEADALSTWHDRRPESLPEGHDGRNGRHRGDNDVDDGP